MDVWAALRLPRFISPVVGVPGFVALNLASQPVLIRYSFRWFAVYEDHTGSPSVCLAETS